MSDRQKQILKDSSKYFIFSLSAMSLVLGKGIPTIITALGSEWTGRVELYLARLSLKLIPSESFPFTTEKRAALL